LDLSWAANSSVVGLSAMESSPRRVRAVPRPSYGFATVTEAKIAPLPMYRFVPSLPAPGVAVDTPGRRSRLAALTKVPTAQYD
jgi:hypothetical protein